MSPFGGSLKFASYVCRACGFQSQENTHSQPARSNASRKPPIPQNRSINLSFDFLVDPLVEYSVVSSPKMRGVLRWLLAFPFIRCFISTDSVSANPNKRVLRVKLSGVELFTLLIEYRKGLDKGCPPPKWDFWAAMVFRHPIPPSPH